MHVIHGGRSHQTNDHPFKIPTQLRLQVINQILEDRKRRKKKKTWPLRRGRTRSPLAFMHQPSLQEQLLWSEQDQKTWPSKACAQCQPYSYGDWDVLHISPEWYNPKKSTSPSYSHRHWSLKSTYPANSAFIGDQNLLTLGNVQFGQGLNDGIFIRAWKEPIKTSQAACTRTRGLLWPRPGCTIGHTSLHNLGLICALVPQPSSTTTQDRENKSLSKDICMAKTWISSGVQVVRFPPVPSHSSEVMQKAELPLQQKYQ